MSRLPPLIALSYFEVAARTKSFALAAKELNVTPAAISHQVKALEEYLGVELFVRHHRRVSLTPAARAALPELHEGFQVIADAVEKIRLYADERNVITVCAEPLFATKWIVPRLHRFYTRYPEAEVRLQASLHSVDPKPDCGFGVSQLKRAGIDVSVRLGYGDYEDVEPECLMRLDLVPMAASALVNTESAALLDPTLPLLCDRTLERFEPLCGWQRWFNIVQREDLAQFKLLQFGNGLLALETAIAGSGYLLGSEALLESELREGKLARLSDSTLECSQAYYVVSAGAGRERTIARDFREWLAEELNPSAE